MAALKVGFVLNKGRRGAPLGKLGKISEQVEKFLIALTHDSGVQAQQGEWLAANFKNSSVAFQAEFQGAVDQQEAETFESNLVFLADFDPDNEGLSGTLREKTALEYAKIGYLIDPDEQIELGIIPHNGGEPRWKAITYHKSESIKTRVETPLRGHGSLQGIIHSWFKEAQNPYFQFRELSTNKLIRVEYKQNQYGRIANAVKERNTVLVISGHCIYERTSRDLVCMRLDSMLETSSLTPGDFNNLWGAFPNFEHDENSAIL